MGSCSRLRRRPKGEAGGSDAGEPCRPRRRRGGIRRCAKELRQALGSCLDLCSMLILQLGKTGSPSEAFSVYNMLRYSKRTQSKSLHEKMLNILVVSGLLKEAYLVMKDNIELISLHSMEKFAMAFMKSGNINMINDVLKACHRSGQRVNQEVFRKAISRYIGKPEKKMLLLHLLQWMSGQGYIVDSKSRNMLLKNSHLFGQKQLIAEILSKQHIMSRTLKSAEVKK